MAGEKSSTAAVEKMKMRRELYLFLAQVLL